MIVSQFLQDFIYRIWAVQFQIAANLLFPDRQGLAQSQPFRINACVRIPFL